MKKTVDDIRVRGLRVLVRLDLNVPIDPQGRITDDRRIRSALPTIKKLRDEGGRLVLMSHLGRPEGDGGDRTKDSLAPVAQQLSRLLGQPVTLADDCVGAEVSTAVANLRDGDVLLLENLRYHSAETIKDSKAASDPKLHEKKLTFAKQIAELGDAYVNDAFGTCHRDNASMLTVPQLMPGKPRVIGYLVEQELRFLGQAMTEPARPFVCLLGGAKVSDKLGVIRALMTRCDTIAIGGAMAYTFLEAKGMNVGKSLVEKDLIETAQVLMKAAGGKLRLPVDSVSADRIASDAGLRLCTDSIPANQMGLDIGPDSIRAFRDVIRGAKTVFWNGPMGVFETPPFDKGTMAMAEAMAEVTKRGAITIVGGGDSAAAIEQAGLADDVTHISTGGGASLEYLEGKRFAPLEVLDNA